MSIAKSVLQNGEAEMIAVMSDLTPKAQRRLAREIASELLIQMRPILRGIVREMMEESSRSVEHDVGMKEASRIIGRSLSWVQKHYRECLPYRRDGGRVLFSPSALQEWKSQSYGG